MIHALHLPSATEVDHSSAMNVTSGRIYRNINEILGKIDNCILFCFLSHIHSACELKLKSNSFLVPHFYLLEIFNCFGTQIHLTSIEAFEVPMLEAVGSTNS